MTLAGRLARWRRVLKEKLWLKPAVASLFSLSIALLALWVGRISDATLGLEVDEASLVTLFTIFASSMLTVATFTLSAIVTAASSASNSTTPRASRTVLSDQTAQRVLSAFIAAFIYSFISIIALKVFQYGPAGRFTLFAGLILMVALVLIAFINWIDHAMKLGRQSTTISKLREAAMKSLTPLAAGTFAAEAFDGTRPAGSAAVKARETGYVSALDTEFLQNTATENGCRIFLTVRPGEYIHANAVIACVTPSAALTEAISEAIEKAVDRDSTRHEEADIRFNIVNLAETADRALSPGINDPGTAILILNELADVIAEWSRLRRSDEARTVRFDRIAVPPLTAREVIADAFTPIARDGAGAVEVGVRLQKTLAYIKSLGDASLAAEAQRMSELALELSGHALIAQTHKDLVADAARTAPAL